MNGLMQSRATMLGSAKPSTVVTGGRGVYGLRNRIAHRHRQRPEGPQSSLGGETRPRGGIRFAGLEVSNVARKTRAVLCWM